MRKTFFFITILLLNNYLSFSNGKLDDNFLYFKKVQIENILNNNCFIIDTGSNISILDISIFNKLTLKKIGCKKLTDILGFKKKRDVFSVNNIVIDGVKFTNISFMVIDFKKTFPCKNIKGIIGTNILKKCIVEINFKRKELKLLKKTFSTVDKILIPLKIKNNLPFVEIKINNIKYKNCLLDLGDVNDLTLNLKDYKFFNKQTQNRVLIIRKSINNQKNNISKIPIVFNNQIDLQLQKIENSIIIFDNHRSIGLSVFGDSKIILCLKRKQLFFYKKHIKLQSYGYKFSHFIKLEKDNKGFYVSQLSELGIFKKKYHINVGEYVEKVNNINLKDVHDKSINRCDILKKINAELKKDILVLKMFNWNSSKKIIF